MMDRRKFVSTAIASAAMMSSVSKSFAAAANYDLILKGGRVIDPSLRIDGIRDVAISGGRIVAVEANIAGAAAETIGANSLLTRVAAYYHDIGKINKADYFIENQTDGRNRHIHLTPNMSFHIITGHVKDGVALAKEYNLASEIIPFIPTEKK